MHVMYEWTLTEHEIELSITTFDEECAATSTGQSIETACVYSFHFIWKMFRKLFKIMVIDVAITNQCAHSVHILTITCMLLGLEHEPFTLRSIRLSRVETLNH